MYVEMICMNSIIDKSCPNYFPYSFMWGMYCCAEKEEGNGKTGEKGCNGGVLRYDSICCKNDKQVKCSKDGGCVDRKCT